jgi:hypothetical protein
MFYEQRYLELCIFKKNMSFKVRMFPIVSRHYFAVEVQEHATADRARRIQAFSYPDPDLHLNYTLKIFKFFFNAFIW